MLHRLSSSARLRWDAWLRRLPGSESGESVLRQNRIFIIPTRAGLGLALLLLVLFVASANYSLSLGFGLTFLIGSCAIVDMCLTYRNLAHLFLAPGRALPVFAGEEASFELHLINRSRYDRYGIWLGGLELPATQSEQAADIAADSSCRLSVQVPALQRGWLAAPTVRLQTRFPLGLLRAWSYWRPEMRLLVYPRPEDPAAPFPGSGSGQGSAGAQPQAGAEDFAGIRPYQTGDAPSRLAWRQMARLDLLHTQSSHMLVKQFEQGNDPQQLYFDLAQLPPEMNLEDQLSRLTRWVLTADAQHLCFGLRLGAQCFLPATGPAHRAACLQALALYPEQR